MIVFYVRAIPRSHRVSTGNGWKSVLLRNDNLNQAKPVAVETVHPNKKRPMVWCGAAGAQMGWR